MKFYIETLGCPKNLVDAQGISRLLTQMGHRSVNDPGRAQVLIVNTCGFIEDAREESLSELRDLARAKRDDQILIAAGCLSQRVGPALKEQVPGLDALLGTRRWGEVDALVRELWDRKGRPDSSVDRLGDSLLLDGEGADRFARQGASAYLKIADGCSAPCAFCAIPLIKGPAVSRPAETVLSDAISLIHQGVKELILIAQDTTAYGRDLGAKDALTDLVRSILASASEEEAEGRDLGLRWLRLMYAYPGHISSRLIETMASNPRLCHYLDLPLQHAHPDTLRRMRRPSNSERTRRLIQALRAAMPDIALRTSFIVGYPGETEYEFETLLEFAAESRFDRVGVFVYSPEEDTPAAALPGAVPEEVKQERYDRLMSLQQEISLEINQSQIGRRLDVLVEGQGEGLSVGRSYRDAPEIDGLVLLPGTLEAGEMVRVRITGAMEYDLIGELEGRRGRP